MILINSSTHSVSSHHSNSYILHGTNIVMLPGIHVFLYEPHQECLPNGDPTFSDLDHFRQYIDPNRKISFGSYGGYSS